MFYLKQALGYFKRNFIFVLAFAVAPAVMYAINNSSANIINLYADIRAGVQSYHFFEIYKNFSLINYRYIYSSLLSFTVTVIFASLALAFIEKHMRIGKKSYSGIIYKLNDNIIPVLTLLILLIAIYEVISVIISALIITVALIFISKTAIFIISLALLLVFYFIIFNIIALFFVWLPCILITGFNNGEAFVYSASLFSDKKPSILFSIALPYLLIGVVTVLVNLFLGSLASFIVLILAYFVYFVYYTALMYIIYFSLTNAKRADLPKKYF